MKETPGGILFVTERKGHERFESVNEMIVTRILDEVE